MQNLSFLRGFWCENDDFIKIMIVFTKYDDLELTKWFHDQKVCAYRDRHATGGALFIRCLRVF